MKYNITERILTSICSSNLFLKYSYKTYHVFGSHDSRPCCEFDVMTRCQTIMKGIITQYLVPPTSLHVKSSFILYTRVQIVLLVTVNIFHLFEWMIMFYDKYTILKCTPLHSLRANSPPPPQRQHHHHDTWCIVMKIGQ